MRERYQERITLLIKCPIDQGFFHKYWLFRGQQGKGGNFFNSTLPLPNAQKHSDIYLQLCIWDDYHVFLIKPFVFTRLLLDEVYHLIELPFHWLMIQILIFCLLTWWFDPRFLLQQFDTGNRWIWTRIESLFHQVGQNKRP